MKKVKNVLIKFDIAGKGVVNYDSMEQRDDFKDTNLHKKMYMYNDNVSYAKKNFYGTKEDLKYKLKISSDCLINAMFGKDIIAQNSKITHNENLLYMYLASPATILRGHLQFPQNETAYKRKGGITITDAEQTNNAMSKMEVFSKSGAKTEKGATDSADNTFYYKETVGNITYDSMGVIDLMQLQFVSTDMLFDRFSFNPDKFELFKSYLGLRVPNFNSELGYFSLTGGIDKTPEYGFQMSSENVVFLVKEFFIRLFTMDIKRRSAFAKVENLQYKLVRDVFTDTFDNPQDWQSIKSLKDIENINFDIQNFYEPVDEKSAEQLLNLIEKSEAQKKVSDAKKKADKKAISDEKKLAKKGVKKESSIQS